MEMTKWMRPGGPLVALLLWAACAKVGDPLPPARVLPAVQDLRIEADARRVLLTFPLPRAEVSALEVWLACGQDGPAEDDFRLSAAVPVARLVPSRQDPQLRTFVTERSRAQPCHYRIRFVDPSGARSAFSNTVRTP
ncbi:MAG TPA: hypothetical protein VLU25_03620 [Acidobacteriota bacterium]|nr:hypothetical protein [Acidobacteriota bacterium]